MQPEAHRIGHREDDPFAILVRVNAFMGADAITGKAERKLYARAYKRLTGKIMPEADVSDVADVARLSAPASQPTGFMAPTREEYIQVTASATSTPEPSADVAETLADFVTGAGFTFDHFASLCESTGQGDDPSSWSGFDEVPPEISALALKNKRRLLSGLNTAKNTAAKGGAQ